MYLTGIVVLSVIANSQKALTRNDYYLVGRSLGKWLLAGTVIATMVNSLAVTGTPSLFYRGGVLFLQMFIAVTGAAILIYIFGPRINAWSSSRGILTQGELFGVYFHSRAVQVTVGLLGILSIFPFLGIQLAGIGKILAIGSNGLISHHYAVLLFAVFTGLYVFVGGARAAVWTDSLQGLTVFALFLTLAVLFHYWSGGMWKSIEIVSHVMPEKLEFQSENFPVFLDNIFSWTFAFFLWPHLFARVFMSRDGKSIREAAVLSAIFLNLLLLIILVATVCATAVLYGELQDPDQLLMVMLQKYLPEGSLLILVLIIALTMSTIDSALLSLSSIFNRDFSGERLHNKGESKGGFHRARYTTIAFLGIAVVFALSTIGTDALIPWATLGASLATLLLWPLLGMFLFKQQSPLPSLFAMYLGFFTIVTMRFFGLLDQVPIGFGTSGFLIGGVTFLVFSFALPSMSGEEDLQGQH